jgi:Bacterial SH3 domain/Pentapeptide repeats (8 copies)
VEFVCPSGDKSLAKRNKLMTIRNTLLSCAAALTLSAGAAAAAPAVVQSDLNIRSGPGAQYPVVGAVPSGETVDVGGCVRSWCQVSFRGGTGYANLNYLATAGGAAGPGYAAAAPGYANPGYANPGQANPGYANPGYANPGYANPGDANPGYVNPGYTNPGDVANDPPAYVTNNPAYVTNNDDDYDEYGPGVGIYVGPRFRHHRHGWDGRWNGGPRVGGNSQGGNWQGRGGNRVGVVGAPAFQPRGVSPQVRVGGVGGPRTSIPTGMRGAGGVRMVGGGGGGRGGFGGRRR